MVRPEPAIRIATLADAPAIDALMKASVAALFPRFYDARQSASAVRYVAEVDRMLLEDGTYFVLEAGGELVACGGWSRRDKLYTGSGDSADDGRPLDPATEAARVRAMFVRSDWTRRGLGRRILDRARTRPEAKASPGSRSSRRCRASRSTSRAASSRSTPSRWRCPTASRSPASRWRGGSASAVAAVAGPVGESPVTSDSTTAEDDGASPPVPRGQREVVAAALTVVVLLAVGGITAAISHDDPSPTALIRPPDSPEKQGFADNGAAVAGARLFVLNGCVTCHTYLGNGTISGDAPTSP